MSSDSPPKSKLRKLFHLNSSADHSVSIAIIKENAKLAWHGFKVVSKNAERLLDGTPFKIPVAVINSIVGIVDVRRRSFDLSFDAYSSLQTIIDSKDSMATILLQIGQRLEIVNMNFEHMWRPDGIDPSCQRFCKYVVFLQEWLSRGN